MKKLICLILTIFLLQIGKLYPQEENCNSTIYYNMEYIEYVFGYVEVFSIQMLYLYDSYYWTYLSYPTTPKDLFSRSEDVELSSYFFDWANKNISYFDLEKNDNTLYVYHKDSILSTYTRHLECNKFTYEPNFFRFIRMFDENNQAMKNVYMDSCFEERHKKIMFENVLKFHEQYGYDANFPSNDNCYLDSSKNDRYAQRGLLVYDNGKLSVHNICKECITLEENDYIESLKEIAEMYCKEYNCKRIIFSAIILKKGK